MTVSVASPIKHRRTKADMEEIRGAMYEIISQEAPMTVRQVFYRLVSAGVIGKTESEYNCTVVRLLTQMRLDGSIPFHWIADNTRWMRKPETHSDLKSMLEITVATYRRALWLDQPVYVEIWLEKDALSGVVYRITSKWDVPLMVTRGYPSLSFLYNAAEAIEAEEKPAYLYYFGDWDPSGVDIPRVIEKRLGELAPGAEIHFERVAVSPDQVGLWDLPTRPTKKTDTRSKSFQGASVELDAIPPNDLRDLVNNCIQGHIDPKVMAKTRVAEESERELLDRWDEILEDIAEDELENFEGEADD